jgi:hypothetical protein
LAIIVDGVDVVDGITNGSGSTVVPSGSVYSATGATPTLWVELR